MIVTVLYVATSKIGNYLASGVRSKSKQIIFKIARLIINLLRFRLLFYALLDIKIHSIDREQSVWLNFSKQWSIVFVFFNMIDLLNIENKIRDGIDKSPEFMLTEKEIYLLEEWTDHLDLLKISSNLKVANTGAIWDKIERKLYFVRNHYRWIGILIIVIYSPYLIKATTWLLLLISVYMCFTYVPKMAKKRLFKQSFKIVSYLCMVKEVCIGVICFTITTLLLASHTFSENLQSSLVSYFHPLIIVIILIFLMLDMALLTTLSIFNLRKWFGKSKARDKKMSYLDRKEHFRAKKSRSTKIMDHDKVAKNEGDLFQHSEEDNKTKPKLSNKLLMKLKKQGSAIHDNAIQSSKTAISKKSLMSKRSSDIQAKFDRLPSKEQNYLMKDSEEMPPKILEECFSAEDSSISLDFRKEIENSRVKVIKPSKKQFVNTHELMKASSTVSAHTSKNLSSIGEININQHKSFKTKILSGDIFNEEDDLGNMSIEQPTNIRMPKNINSK
jgi:hypothetical protein